METYVALKKLSEGFKIRRICWGKKDYIKLNKNGIIVDKRNNLCPIQFTKLHEDWEILE